MWEDMAWPNLQYAPATFLEALTKYISEVSRSHSRDFNPRACE